MLRSLREVLEEEEIPYLRDSSGRSWGRARKVADLHLPSSPPRSPHKIIRVEELYLEKDSSAFAVRRSERKTEGFLLNKLLSTKDDATLGLKIFETGDRGRGVKTSRKFSKGDFVVEYAGDLVSEAEALAREARYKADPRKGSFMYFFEHKGKPYCVDATEESGRYGRLVNHSLKESNCFTKVFTFQDIPRLVLVAKQDLQVGAELLYDYGERDPETLQALPWLTE